MKRVFSELSLMFYTYFKIELEQDYRAYRHLLVLAVYAKSDQLEALEIELSPEVNNILL